MAYPTTIPVRLLWQGEYAVINGKRYVPEKTCRIVWHSNEFGLFDLHCSECCSLLLIQRDGSETQPNYCPNCGAKAIE